MMSYSLLLGFLFSGSIRASDFFRWSLEKEKFTNAKNINLKNITHMHICCFSSLQIAYNIAIAVNNTLWLALLQGEFPLIMDLGMVVLPSWLLPWASPTFRAKLLDTIIIWPKKLLCMKKVQIEPLIVAPAARLMVAPARTTPIETPAI